MPEDEPFNIPLPPGTRVAYHGWEQGVEFGIVVHTWLDHYDYANIVALFGFQPPEDGAIDEYPYILRYSSISLEILNEDWSYKEQRPRHFMNRANFKLYQDHKVLALPTQEDAMV